MGCAGDSTMCQGLFWYCAIRETCEEETTITATQTKDPEDELWSEAFRELVTKAKQLKAALVDLRQIRQKSSICSSRLLDYPGAADEQTLFAISNEQDSSR